MGNRPGARIRRSEGFAPVSDLPPGNPENARDALRWRVRRAELGREPNRPAPHRQNYGVALSPSPVALPSPAPSPAAASPSPAPAAGAAIAQTSPTWRSAGLTAVISTS